MTPDRGTEKIDRQALSQGRCGRKNGVAYELPPISHRSVAAGEGGPDSAAAAAFDGRGCRRRGAAGAGRSPDGGGDRRVELRLLLHAVGTEAGREVDCQPERGGRRRLGGTGGDRAHAPGTLPAAWAAGVDRDRDGGDRHGGLGRAGEGERTAAG